jgi:DNA-binding NarL/FixJ family response regulator
MPVDVRDLDDDELAILAQLTQGCNNPEIATALGIAETVVRRRMTSIVAKVGVRNRYQAMMIAHRENLDVAAASTPSGEPDPAARPVESPTAKSAPPAEPAPVVAEPAPLAGPCPRPVVIELEPPGLAAELPVLDLQRVRYGALDERHRDVVHLIATGYDDNALCYALALPHTTVQLVVNSLIHTFRVRTRADVQALGLELFPGIKRLRQRVVPNETLTTPSIADLHAAGTQPSPVSPTLLTPRDSTITPGNPLTEREQCVMDAIARGASSNAEIAKTLSLQTETVKTHLKRIFLKLHVDSRYEALAVCLTNTWVSDPVTADDAECLNRLVHMRKYRKGRQNDVLDLVAAGYRNGEIARKLDLSLNTAKHYVWDISRQLGVRGRCHVIALVHRASSLHDLDVTER